MTGPDKFETDLRASIAEKRSAIERLRQELDRDERTLAARLDVSVKALRKLLAEETSEPSDSRDDEPCPVSAAAE